MEPKDFCRWLQGVLDISGLDNLNEEQIAMIRIHLNTVFEDVTGGGMAGIDRKYRAAYPMPWDEKKCEAEDEEIVEEADDELSDLSDDLTKAAWCMMKDDSKEIEDEEKNEDPKQQASDPFHKENAWKVDPSIKTVLSC